MFLDNPFTSAAEFVPSLAMRVYIVLMMLAVAVGTLADVHHKGSARFFTRRREKAKAFARRRLTGTETVVIAMKTFGEAAISGEFSKWRRRTSHLLMMYGFILHVIATIIMVFAYPPGTETPLLLTALWDIGALMIVIGGLWFFLFLRANVVFDGDSPWHVGRADIFVLLLIGSAAFALAWHFVQATFQSSGANLIFFIVYVAFTTLLFVSVPWSKFAHMFYKPAVAFQRKVEEADGSSDLPSSAPIPDTDTRR